MRPDDFFIDQTIPAAWGLPSERIVNDDLLVALRRGAVEGLPDVEVAGALARLVHDDLERFGTSGGEELSIQGMRAAILALRAVVTRIGVSDFDLPFRDYSSFKSFWLRNDGYGSWQARRDLLNSLIDPLHDRLIVLESQSLDSSLAQPISPRSTTGWARVDEEVLELRRHFQIARTAQDYRNVGNDCVIVIETLSRQVYDPAVHLREGEQVPPVTMTKARIERFIEDAAPGSGQADLRKLARAAIEFAQSVKHSATGTRRDAGIAADAVILLANLLRRLDEPI
ncbi:hypothetical protein AB0E63_22705 [Kribbella sp. NPDC026596]|uniref:hypothetical protein n=1 Tax=Kribbella sp. NPDC026596 TaxID=3155122 RepID=UPI0033EBE7A0